MSPYPDRVIVASDEPIETEFEVVPCGIKSLGPMRQAAIDATDTEWFVPSDLDDLPLPNYIRDLNPDCDIHSFALEINNSVFKGIPDQWESAFSINTGNPLISCSAFKTKWKESVRFRDVGWEDWAFWLDMKKAGAKVFFDDTIRYIYTRPSNSLSQQNTNEKQLEIRQMKLSGVW
jgi:hypothetical protein